MEKEIESIIDSFIFDFDQRKLELLDRIFFSLLLKKEIFLLKNKRRNNEVKKIEKILSRYADYRNLIYKRLQKKGCGDKDFLIRNIYPPPGRLILLLTHNCQLRCKYCQVRKFSATMKEDTLFKGIVLLFTSHRQDLQLQFFGGEPLLRFDLIKKAVDYAENINKRFKRDLTFILTTNGIALTKEKIDFFKKHKFIIECSIDGEVQNQLKARRACDGKNYYSKVRKNFEYLFQSNTPHYSISVVMPENVLFMSKSFDHLVNLGFRKLQMNYSLGVFWTERAIKRLFTETKKIAIRYLKRKGDIEFINMTPMRREPVVLNAELTVDCDGGIYLESGICLEEDFLAMKNKFLITDVRKIKNINFYKTTQFQNFYRLSKIYGSANPQFRRIILNNVFLGRSYDIFIRKAADDSSFVEEKK